MNNFVSNYVKKLDSEFAGLASDGVIGDVHSFIDTGSYVFNALISGSIYGGIPEGKVIALAGEEATGKTFFWLTMAKHFMDKNEQAQIVCFESEGALTQDILIEKGIDLSRIAIVSISTVQEFKNKALNCLQEYEGIPDGERPPLLLVVDSLGMLSTSKELEDSMDGKETKDMTRAQIIRAAFRVLTLKMSKVRVSCIITNHTFDVIGSMYPAKDMSGGRSLKFAASTIVFLSRRKEKVGTDVVGNVIHAKLIKSRLARPDMTVDTLLLYDRGLSKHYGLLELGVECGIIKSVSQRYEFPDGKKFYKKAIYENPEEYFAQEILDAIDAYAKTKFSYGGSAATVGQKEECAEILDKGTDL